MRNLRWPIILFVPLLVAALFFWEQGEEPVSNVGTTSANPLSWFCPVLDKVEPLRLINPTDTDTNARVTIYSSIFEADGDLESRPYILGVFDIEVPGNGSELAFANNLLDVLVPELRPQDVARIADLKQNSAVFLAASVEFEILGPVADPSICINQSGTEWILPFASTHRDACYFLAIFNPFPNTAIIDLQFATDGGLRDPLQGVVIPQRSLVILDVGESIVRRSHISTHLTTRIGKVIVSKYQTFTGKSLALPRRCPEALHPFPTEPDADFSRIWGSEIVLGSPESSKVWYFPAGTNPLAAGSYSIYNPDPLNSVEVKVTLTTELGAPSIKTFVVPPAQRSSLRMSAGTLHPLPTFPAVVERPVLGAEGQRYWAIFEAESGVVIEKIETRIFTPYGIDASLGVLSPQNEIPLYKHLLNFRAGAKIAFVGVANPSSDTIAIISVPGIIGNVEIPPQRRFALGLPEAGLGDRELLISDTPVLVGPYF